MHVRFQYTVASLAHPRGHKSPFIRNSQPNPGTAVVLGLRRTGTCERAWDFVTLGFELALRTRALAFSVAVRARARFLTQARASSSRARRIHDISPDNTSMMLLLLLLLCMPMMLSSIVLEDDSNALIQDISYVPSSAILPFFSGFQTPVREPS